MISPIASVALKGRRWRCIDFILDIVPGRKACSVPADDRSSKCQLRGSQAPNLEAILPLHPSSAILPLTTTLTDPSSFPHNALSPSTPPMRPKPYLPPPPTTPFPPLPRLPNNPHPNPHQPPNMGNRSHRPPLTPTPLLLRPPLLHPRPAARSRCRPHLRHRPYDAAARRNWLKTRYCGHMVQFGAQHDCDSYVYSGSRYLRRAGEAL